MAKLSLQKKYAPHNACFGCGLANPQGLKLQSFIQDDGVVAVWQPNAYYEGFAGCVNGGVISALLDCHSNWAAASALMQHLGRETPPCTVTADLHVKFLRPTPSDAPLSLFAKALEIKNNDRVIVEATLSANNKICATCLSTFVAVKPGHPAYDRW